jgi:hypothetical protein
VVIHGGGAGRKRFLKILLAVVVETAIFSVLVRFPLFSTQGDSLRELGSVMTEIAFVGDAAPERASSPSSSQQGVNV